MKSIRNTIIVLNLVIFLFSGKAQITEQGIYNLFLQFENFYSSNDLLSAEECMLRVIESEKSLSEVHLVFAYNNLGVLNNLLGRYQEALIYFDKAETQSINNPQFQRTLAVIYSNKARIYNIQKLYYKAIEYLEKGIRINMNIDNPDNNIFMSMSNSYINIGISYNGIKDYKNALLSFQKSADLKKKYSLPELGLSYLNLAQTYVKSGDKNRAEKLFLKSIDEFSINNGKDYYRLADIFTEYGHFLEAEGRDRDALEYYNKSLIICIKNFGNKHPEISKAYKNLGNHYLKRNVCDTALQNYQNALIAHIRNFYQADFQFNPSIDSADLDIDLLDILHKKTNALEKLAFQQDNQERRRALLTKSYETIGLAIQGIGKLHNAYLSDESRLYLAENEKETYFTSIRMAQELYHITGNPYYSNISYNIARDAKAAVLRQKILDNKLFYSLGFPDSLSRKYQKILRGVSAYNHLIYDELKEPDPDNQKLDYWKDALFRMNRDKEKIESEINRLFPHYREVFQKLEPAALEDMQKDLAKDEVMIDYFLSNQNISGKRKLYIFAITRNSLYIRDAFLDSVFTHDIGVMKKNTDKGTIQKSDKWEYIIALYRMYEKLFKPIEDFIKGNRVIIIPDEEIALLSFDSFIKKLPDKEHVYYDGLEYLLKDFTFSYGYSSALVFEKHKPSSITPDVYAFSPYDEDLIDNVTSGPDYLSGALEEINAIYQNFQGRKYTGAEASEKNFKASIGNASILHLAMHAETDTSNPEYSCLIFNTLKDTTEDGKLFNYEISLSRINSPMVVLSACNTGSGELYRGEGVMSLARGFILASASSVIKTAWDVNDETSAGIISSFYTYLYKGKAKDEALRMAKLDYLKKSPPTYSDPFYWAAYQVIGDNSPVVIRKKCCLFLLAASLLLAGLGVWIFYFKRRRSFSARSW